MNWFERYGIVGMFFIFMTTIWLLCLSPLPADFICTITSNKELSKYVVGFASLAFIPIGYLIMISSQLLYYRKGDKIHCNYWQNMPDKIKDEILTKEKEKGMKELSEADQNDEVKMEAIITYYDRKFIKSVEINKFLSEFGTKRYDVIAINYGCCCAIILSFITAICLKLIILNFSLRELIDLTLFSSWIAIVLSVIIWGILKKSRINLSLQILEIGTRIMSDIEVKKD